MSLIPKLHGTTTKESFLNAHLLGHRLQSQKERVPPQETTLREITSLSKRQCRTKTTKTSQRRRTQIQLEIDKKGSHRNG